MSLLNSYRASLSDLAALPLLPGNDLYGFAGGDVWRQPDTLSQSDRDHLDNLVGHALIDQDIHDRLLRHRDPSLFDVFKVSDETRNWCATVQASTLQEFAEAIIAAATPNYQRAKTTAL